MSQTPVAPSVLPYADHVTGPSPWRTTPMRIVLACWLLPLVTGTGVFVASEIVRLTVPPGLSAVPFHGGPSSPKFHALMQCGLGVIGFGIVATVVGLVSMDVFIARRLRGGVKSWRREIGLPVLCAVSLLGSNFVVALLLAGLAMR